MSPLETNTRLVKTFLSLSVGLSTYSKCHKRGSGGSGFASSFGNWRRKASQVRILLPRLLVVGDDGKGWYIIMPAFFYCIKILQ